MRTLRLFRFLSPGRPDGRGRSRSVIDRLLVIALAILSLWSCGVVQAEEWDLGRVSGYGLEHNPKLVAAKQAVQAARARIDENLADYYPALNFQTDYSRLGGYSSSGSSASGGDRNLYSASLGLSHNIYDFGRTRYRVRTSRYDVETLQWDLKDVRLGVVDDIAEAYYGVLLADRSVKLRQEDLARTREHLTQAQTFYKVGTKARIDVIQAQVEAIKAEKALLQAQSNARTSRVLLQKTMGLETAPSFSLKDDLDTGRVDWRLEDLKKEALKHNPLLNHLRAVVNSAESQEMVARSDFWPQLSGTAGYGWTGSESPSDPAWNVGVQLTVPLFSGFQTRARVSETRAALAQSKANVEVQRLEVLNDIETQFANLLLGEKQMEVAGEALGSARENFELSTGRYKAGVGTILEVTDARVSLAQAETDCVQAAYDYKIARFKLERTVGRE
ncbi:MAG: TolC family protein [Candidatus Latescibacterota bacterium]